MQVAQINLQSYKHTRARTSSAASVLREQIKRFTVSVLVDRFIVVCAAHHSLLPNKSPASAAVRVSVCES